MPKTKKRNVTEAPKKGLQHVYDQILDGIEKSFTLDSSDLERQRFSTGILSVDITLGGGLSSGLTIISGQEASAKSTLAAHVSGSAMRLQIPINQMRDAEGSCDSVYTRNIWNIDDLTDAVGQKDNNGKWVVKPKIRYYDTNLFEKTWNSIISTLNKIPDKLYRQEEQQWYYVLESRDKRTELFVDALGKPSQKLKQSTGLLWFPCDNPWPQSVIVVDSLPTLIPEETDDNEKDDKALAFMARAYAKTLPRVVGKLRRKHVILWGVNQIREKPMVMFGSPIYEPLGNALKFFSSCRNQIFSYSVPEPWRTKGSSTIATEKAMIGDGQDRFAWKKMRNTKNKFGSPYLECWTRVWISDSNGEGRGFDLAYDTWQAMQHAGLAKETFKKIKGEKSERALQFTDNLPKELQDFNKKLIGWTDFKPIIHKETFSDREIKDLAAKKSALYNLNPKAQYRARLGKLINSKELSYHKINDKGVE